MWVVIDIIDVLMHIPMIKTLLGIATIGIAWLISYVPFVVKIALILWFARSALGL